MEIGVYSFDLVAKSEIQLPIYKGSAFRGVFGHALKKTVCITDRINCDNCLLVNNCAYHYIFETKNERGENVAHPFVLEPPLTEKRLFPPGERLKVRLILMGKAINYLPYIIFAFREMGRRGIGFKRGKFWVENVYEGEGAKHLVYNHLEQKLKINSHTINLTSFNEENASEINISFITPTAIKTNGKVTSKLSFSLLIKNIIRRLNALSYYHNGSINNLVKLSSDSVSSVEVINDNLSPYSWKRYSNRQKTKILFDGFIGTIQFKGDLTPFIPLLRSGEYIHVGRGTVYGMGMYQINSIKP